MSKFIDALTRAKPRLIAMSPLIAAGAVASVATAPALTTGVAIVAALQALSGLASNIVASDVHEKLSERVLRADVLKNHDLARAVRDAINVVILDAANDISDEREKTALEQMAIADETVWAEAETLLRQPQTIGKLATNDVIEMFSKSAEEFARFKALDLEDWRDIVSGLATVNSFAVEGDVFSAAGALKLSKSTVDLTASHLYETFPRALYEILKEDFAEEGKSYGGLLIKLVGNISANQIETLEAAYEILDVTKKTLETAERIEDKVDRLHEKLDLIHTPHISTPARLTINLPPRNRIFTGRRDVLDDLKRKLEKSNRAALSGMPGVGKTQTAIEYAHEQYASQAYAYVVYARATTETELLTDFVGAAQSLNLPIKDTADVNKVASAVKAWLECEDKWLLIFDNADDLTVVHSHIPANPKGHVIFTRRPDDAGSIAHSIKIKKMDADEGALLLLCRAKLMKDADTLDAAISDSAEQARAISRELDGLPLSLGIAGAFIVETSTSLIEYLELYRTQGRKLRQERDPHSLYEHSVATVFALAFKQLATPDDDKEESAIIARAAADLLRLCSFFAPDTIPLTLILTDKATLGDDLQRTLADKIWMKKTFARALRFSLLAGNPQTLTFDMHREVQAVIHDEMDYGAQCFWAERALHTLTVITPNPINFANWGMFDLLLPHAQNCLKHIDTLEIETEVVAQLKNKTGVHLENRSRYEEAAPLLEQALALRKKLLGTEHEAVAQSMNNLAGVYSWQGRYEEAATLNNQALQLLKKLFGTEHRGIAQVMNNLAYTYRKLGRYEEAAPLLEQALALRKKLLGFDHSDVAESMNNLGQLYYTQGRYEEAAPLFERTLKILTKLYGKEHPRIAATMNNLSALYSAGGLFKEAEMLVMSALTILERIVGPNHLYTVTTRQNLEQIRRFKVLQEFLEQSNIKDGGESDSD